MFSNVRVQVPSPAPSEPKGSDFSFVGRRGLEAAERPDESEEIEKTKEKRGILCRFAKANAEKSRQGKYRAGGR